FCQDGEQAGDTEAVGAHGWDGALAVFVQDLDVEGFGVLAAELEDMANFDASSKGEGALACWCWFAFLDFCSFDEDVWGEIASGDEAYDVAFLFIGAGDPGGTGDNARIGKDLHAVLGQANWSDVALDQEWVVGKVGFHCEFNFCWLK